MSDPFEKLPKTPSFSITSKDVHDGEKLKLPQVSGIFGAGGQDFSPELSWSGFPAATKSFAVTMFDPDAPTGSGFWHWAVVDVPAHVTSLAGGAGEKGGLKLPSRAFQLRNDAGLALYLGAAPPMGHGRHRYFIVVYAVDTESLGIDTDATPAFLGFSLSTHTLARAVVVPWYER